MDIDLLFKQPFHVTAEQFNDTLRRYVEPWSLRPIGTMFPFSKFVTDGDEFYRKVWGAIDRCQDYFWMTTYAIDSSPAADVTLHKLSDAARRGVNVIFFVDNVQEWAKKELIQEFVRAGGKYMILNPQFELKSLYQYLTKDVWRRHHEKLIVSDSMAMIGSANVEGHYAGINYGNSSYRDLNFYSENIIMDQYRQHFIDTANCYRYDVGTGQYSDSDDYLLSNHAYLSKYNEKYPNSQFYDSGRYTLLHNNQKQRKREVEDSVINGIKGCQQEIKVVQAYHYTMSRFERQVQNIISTRGIIPDIITSGRRDQPVFKLMTNEMLFDRLLKQGVNVFETREKLLHSKVYMFDRRWLNLGSMNNDRWSWAINNECNILIDGPREYEELDHYFENLKQKCRRVKHGYTITLEQATSVNFWQWFLYLSEIVMSNSGIPEEDYR